MSEKVKLICHPGTGWSLEGGEIGCPLAPLKMGRAFWGDVFLWLAGPGMEKSYESGLVWMREWIVRCVEKIAVSRTLSECCPWAGTELNAWREEMPLIPGAEYVGEVLMCESGAALWKAVVAGVAKHKGDCGVWLDSLGQHWNLVGKVVFHLAELPSGGERPFGFLATYADGISGEGKTQHVPLARLIQRCRRDGKGMDFFLSPLRTAAESSPWLREWLESGRLLRAESLSVEEAYSFLREVPVLRKAGVVTRMPAAWKEKPPSRVVVQVEIGRKEGIREAGRPLWMFNSSLALDGTPLTDEELARIRSSEAGLISLRGKWVEVDKGKVDSLLADWRQLKYLYSQGIPLSGAMRLLAGLGSSLPVVREETKSDEDGWSRIQAGSDLEECLRSIREMPALSLDGLVQAELRPYQREGVSWLWTLYRLGLGACLADDMGLGKTLQVLAFLSLVRREKAEEKGPVLVVVPASLLSNWEEEMKRFAPHLRRMVYHGSSASCLEGSAGADVVFTTYSLIHRREELMEKDWEVVIFDEAQNLKNASSLQSVAAFRLRASLKVALTGTPVENGLSDLWSLMNILNPGLMGVSYSSFAGELETLPREERYARLRKLIAPVLLRRMKTDPHILLHLPPKTELIQRCVFTRRQALLYEHLTEELRKQLFSAQTPRVESSEGEERGNARNALVLRYMLKFKQLCDHPSLLNGDNVFHPEEGGKFMRLKELAEEWVLRQEKVLVFTQFREMCQPLARFLGRIYNREGLVMHGGTPLEKRREDVAAFQQSDGPPFFVLSVKTAGTGLTLTEASHVVHFDRWWNPSVENQASDRAYRLGQTKSVFIHKMMVPGTLEEKIDRLINSKQELARDILSIEKGVEKTLCRMSDEELISFITGK